MSKPTVLISGCSDGSLGSELALQFHASGYRVFATARNLDKLANVKITGIETLALDVLSNTSIEKCVAEVRRLTDGSLDILVNNAGAFYSTALTDASVSESKKLFDLNVWAQLSMIHSFLPLLLNSSRGGLIVNHTSTASVVSVPFSAVYGASKAAFALLTAGLRLELEPFGIKVIDLKSGSTKSNVEDKPGETVPKNSLYYSAREWLNYLLSGKELMKDAYPADVWAKQVVNDISKKNPPQEIWVGAFARLVWWSQWFPAWAVRILLRDVVKMGVIEKKIKEYGKENAIKDAYGAGAATQ
jgi:1-acylglycerone phosphate reductase